MVALGVAALVHVVRYALLIVNRSMLLNPLVALRRRPGLGVAASVVAVFMIVASAVVLTNWLIARRAAAFAHHRPRRSAPGCGSCGGLPGAAGQPVLGAGLRHRAGGVEERLSLAAHGRIAVWWCVWVVEHRGVGVLDRDELHPAMRRASPTTP